MKSVSAVEISQNAKIGLMSATYVTQKTCGDCIFLNNGCYAEFGNAAFQTRRLNRASEEKTIIEIAKEEAEAIDRLSGRLPLRLHVVGDCPTNESVKIVANAAERYMKRKGNIAYTYTHQWKNVLRKNWKKVSVLASCNNTQEVKKARQKGWATAIVVNSHPDNTKKAYVKDGVKIVPCPAQENKNITCADCKLCMKEGLLKKAKITIGFKPDFNTHKKIGNALVNISI